MQAWRKLSLKYHPDKTQTPDCICVEALRPFNSEEVEGRLGQGSLFNPSRAAPMETFSCAGCSTYLRLGSKSLHILTLQVPTI